jgi:cysteine-rich repeat protein
MNKLRIGALTIFFSFILSLGGIFIAHLSDQSIAKRRGKVTICHIPPDDPANYHEINVPENAIPHHLSHGDCPGPCVDSDGDGIVDCNDLCPNGIVDPGEECDDGNNTSGDGCSSTCTLESVCGDGTVEGNEQCDDGNNMDEDGCQGDCTLPSCGNEIVEVFEGCDPPGHACDGDSDGFLDGFCDTKCQCPTAPTGCGDGILDSDEQCDDGNRTNGDGCRANCTEEVCGDGIKDPQEECDDGNIVSGDGCTAGCASETTPSCDDGITNGDETGVDCGGSCDGCPGGSACSDSNDCETDICFTGICQPTQCGDGVINGNEECDGADLGGATCLDLGFPGGTLSCKASCDFDKSGCNILASCGDGLVDPPEECDNGLANSDSAPDACRTNCTNPFCGDGVQDTGEECDDGNNVDGDGCHGDCTIEGCGDAIIDSEVFVTDGILSFFIDTYEASRPDADSVQPGVAGYRACSSKGKLPWVNLTWTEADAACSAAGKRLCTEEEWQLACEGTALNTFPYGNVYDPMACNGKDYDPDCSPPDTDKVLPTGTDYGCPTPVENSCESEFGAFDMSGNVKEWTATQASSAPSTYRIRGGAYDTFEGGLECGYAFVSAEESFHFANLGFRCCRDPQCSDGVDNDGDMAIDFPDDAQCSSATDDDEGA